LRGALHFKIEITKKQTLRTTESNSRYENIDKMSTREMLESINTEDRSVPVAISRVIPQIEKAVDHIAEKMAQGGRLFYLGAGTSGRLGVIDASELPPTFGADPHWVVGLIAGGDGAIRHAVEFAEDDDQGAWSDLSLYSPTPLDVILGIAASGTTPYVVGALRQAQKEGISTSCIVCNENSPIAQYADFPIEVVVGPEFITGSTRMKAGTAQKLVLNMLSTSVMVKLGRVRGNKMVDMALSNAKLVDRGTNMVIAETGLNTLQAKALLDQHGSVRAAVDAHNAR
jgi:N-acetylmuramic acid 6-phosphate etherase